jgi:hypothetical protein
MTMSSSCGGDHFLVEFDGEAFLVGFDLFLAAGEGEFGLVGLGRRRGFWGGR